MELNTLHPDQRWHPAARVVASLVTGVALAYAAAFLVFAGLIVISGCFIECSASAPNPVVGSLLILAGVAAGAGVITSIATAIAGRRAPLMAVFASSALVIAALLAVALFDS